MNNDLIERLAIAMCEAENLYAAEHNMDGPGSYAYQDESTQGLARAYAKAAIAIVREALLSDGVITALFTEDPMAPFIPNAGDIEATRRTMNLALTAAGLVVDEQEDE